MPEAVRKATRWKSVVSNARAIRGALGECLKLSDQLSDLELKREAMRFVNAMEHLSASLLGERTRLKPHPASEKELIVRLREEVAHIRQLLDENESIVLELGDSEAKELLVTSANRLNKFAGVIDRKHR
jgi:hypothetical protein